MASRGAPSDWLPKNRLGVLTEKPSRDGSLSKEVASASAPLFAPGSGWDSSDNETSYCGSGGAFKAAASSGSSGARAREVPAAVLAPAMGGLTVAGFSLGAASNGAAASGGGATTRRSLFSVRPPLEKSEP